MLRWLQFLLPPLHVYTDGSLKMGRGSWAFVIVCRGKTLREGSGKTRHTTSNRMEFQAAIEALKILPLKRRIVFHTDSRVLLEALDRMPLWKSQGWLKSGERSIPSVDQMQVIDHLLQGRNVQWQWVKAHSGVVFNERCDQLCILARESRLS